MELFTPVPIEAVIGFGVALVVSSESPLLLLDSSLTVKAASASFCRKFSLEVSEVPGRALADLGKGEWSAPQLQSLLRATMAGNAAIDGYEMDLIRPGHAPCRLVLNAHKLDYDDSHGALVVLAVTDITAARLAEKIKDQLIRDKEFLLQELQHRVANSLQIIASVLMQSARRVQYEETRLHLHDAHHRVMSIATLQKQLAQNKMGDVELRSYFRDLCASIGASMIHDPDLISLTVTVDDSVTSADTSVSLGLIVTELVINALKHAFPGRDQHGAIAVGYRSDDSDWTLSVGDDGVGMTIDDKPTRSGLGTGIVETLAKQLDAHISVTGCNPGTLVSIVHSPA